MKQIYGQISFGNKRCHVRRKGNIVTAVSLFSAFALPGFAQVLHGPPPPPHSHCFAPVCLSLYVSITHSLIQNYKSKNVHKSSMEA